MSLLEQETIRKERVDKKTLQLEFKYNGMGMKYKVEVICDSAVYDRES